MIILYNQNNHWKLPDFDGSESTKWKSLSRVWLCDPMDCSPPGSSVHGIPQARILEWVAIPFFRGSSQPSHATQVSSTVGRFFASLATREAQLGNKTLRGDRVDILWGCKISIILLCLGHFFYDEIQIYTHVGDRSAFQTGQWWRICLPMQETLVRSLGWEDTLKKDMATHSSIMQG